MTNESQYGWKDLLTAQTAISDDQLCDQVATLCECQCDFDEEGIYINGAISIFLDQGKANMVDWDNDRNILFNKQQFGYIVRHLQKLYEAMNE